MPRSHPHRARRFLLDVYKRQLEDRAEGGEGAGAVAHAVLLVGVELRHRLVRAGHDEQRVVAEATGTARHPRDRSLACLLYTSWLVGPMAWTCSDDATLSPAEPNALDAIAPTDAFPARYFFVGRAGASAYASIESAAEGAPDRELEGGWAVAVVEQREVDGARWARTSKGLWIALADLVAARPSEFRGEAIEDGKLDVAWVLADRASVFAGPSPKGKGESARVRFQLVHLREESGPMVRVEEGGWMVSRDLSRPSLAAPPAEATDVYKRQLRRGARRR